MEDYNSETDSDYTSYWRDWVGLYFLNENCLSFFPHLFSLLFATFHFRSVAP